MKSGEKSARRILTPELTPKREFFEKFVERRPFDPEGLFRLGQTLKALNLNQEAGEMFRRCVEAAQTSPDNRRGQRRKLGAYGVKTTRGLELF